MSNGHKSLQTQFSSQSFISTEQNTYFLNLMQYKKKNLSYSKICVSDTIFINNQPSKILNSKEEKKFLQT